MNFKFILVQPYSLLPYQEISHCPLGSLSRSRWATLRMKLLLLNPHMSKQDWLSVCLFQQLQWIRPSWEPSFHSTLWKWNF